MASHEELKMVEARPDFIELFAGIRYMTYETPHEPTDGLDHGYITHRAVG